LPESADGNEIDFQTFDATGVGLGDICGRHEVAAFLVGLAEFQQAVGFEGVGIPFAFDGINTAGGLRDDKVDFAVGFVAPEANASAWRQILHLPRGM